MIEQLGSVQELDLTFHRTTSLYTIEITKLDWEHLGLKFAFEVGARSIVVAEITVGPVYDWNKQNPDLQVKAKDRIVAVNGEPGSANELVDRIKKTEEILQLSFWRPPASRTDFFDQAEAETTADLSGRSMT